jgi:hypothetical protein
VAQTVEEWRWVVGYEGIYEVSNYGRVYSVPRRNTQGGVLAQVLVNSYLKVALHRNGRKRIRPVHQLVAEAFIGPCPPGEEVRHGPEGKLDNRASQLCYGTKIDNARDKERDGTSYGGESHVRSKLSIVKVSDARRRAALGEPVDSLAREMGVTWSAMHSAITGKSWRSCPTPPVQMTRGRCGTDNRNSKLTEQIIAECRQRHAAGESSTSLAQEFGVTRGTMWKVLSGRTWSHSV